MNEMRKLMEAIKKINEETGGPFKNQNDAQTNARSEIGGGKEGVNFKTYEKDGDWYWTEQVNEDYGFAINEETGGPFKNQNDAQTNARSEIGGGKEGVNFKTYEKNGEWYWTEQVNEDYGFAPDVREVTNKLHELMDEGILDPRAVADAALRYLSEDDVKDMAHANELIYDQEDNNE